MGVAAYNRGSRVIQFQIEQDFPSHDVAFEILARLNALPKFEDCGVPFDDVIFEYDQRRGCWWVMDSVALYGGWSFFYKSLSEAVRRWKVDVVACDTMTGRYLGSKR
ncbi:hypothetical protein A1353_24800 [Methylomonas methanica]|uniref:Uncharacterized protein n=1 Tax=Methylomonas methanica TaxID=421 RepID=A0A177MTG2_METMH|nr:hypothetical protein A1353_24800 [Methylomonas methanica]